MIRCLDHLSYKVRLREPGKEKATRRPYHDLQKGGIETFYVPLVTRGNDFQLKAGQHNY